MSRPRLRGTGYGMGDETRKCYINYRAQCKMKIQGPLFVRHLYSGSVRQQKWLKLQKWKIESRTICMLRSVSWV